LKLYDFFFTGPSDLWNYSLYTPCTILHATGFELSPNFEDCILPYAVEDNIERNKNELNVVLNESLNTINKGNGNKVSSVGIIHVEAA
jgi:hypothetical protein